MCFRQHLHPISPFSLTSRHRHLFAGLFGCNRFVLIVCCPLVIYIHTFVSPCLCVYSFPLCRRAVSLHSFTRTDVRVSLSLSPFSIYHLLFGSRPRWSRLVSPRKRLITRQRRQEVQQREPYCGSGPEGNHTVPNECPVMPGRSERCFRHCW